MNSKRKFFYMLCLAAVISCNRTQVADPAIEGELYAKNTVKTVFRGTPETEYAYAWHVSDRPDGDWTLLQGIHTPEIVLLTEYAGKYLKCEITPTKQGKIFPAAAVISETPVEDRGNPNTDWFREGGLGLMVHFLKGAYTSGGSEEWNGITDGFDVELFARQCRDAGVAYVLWALGQNDGYYNSPNAAYDRIAGVNPGDLCSRRDLPADLIKALKPYGIRLMLYLPSNPPIHNEAIAQKFQYTYGKDSPTSQHTQALWESVIREWALRYGEDLSGWWFDGMYSDIMKLRSDMSLEHNISTHTLAAKAGNPQCIVAYNCSMATIGSHTPYDDYSAGERNDIDLLPEGRWVVPGVQWFHFTFLGGMWGYPDTQHPTDTLTAWAEKVFEKEGVLCFDVRVGSDGRIDAPQMEQLKALARTRDRK
jgi:hypothetical protein